MEYDQTTQVPRGQMDLSSEGGKTVDLLKGPDFLDVRRGKAPYLCDRPRAQLR